LEKNLSIPSTSIKRRKTAAHKYGRSPTDYPNPVHQPNQCGISSLLDDDDDMNALNEDKKGQPGGKQSLIINDKGHPLYLCDPSKVLNETGLQKIQFALNNFTNFVNNEQDAISESILRCEEDKIGYTPRRTRSRNRSLKGVGVRRRAFRSKVFHWDRIEDSIKNAYKWDRSDETSIPENGVNHHESTDQHRHLHIGVSSKKQARIIEQNSNQRQDLNALHISENSDRVQRKRKLNFWNYLANHGDSEDRFLELIGEGNDGTDDGYAFDFFDDDHNDDKNSKDFDPYEEERKDMNQIRIAVAIVEKINLRAILHALSYYTYEDEDDMVNDAAQYFAEYLYDSWKLGYSGGSNKNCGPTGILIFLSVKDRVCFISTGRKVNAILPWWRLEGVISRIKPDLRSEDYEKAILNTIDELERLVSLGPPTFSDRFHDFLERFGVVIMFALFTFIFAVWGEYRDRWNRWQLTETMSRLNQKEKSDALSLQREYHCTACPICLENFEHKKAEKRKLWMCVGNRIIHQSSGDDQVDNLVGSDDLPLKLLRCGHVFCETCWKAWVSSGQGNPYACPVCRQDVGGMLFRSSYSYSGNHNQGVIGRESQVLRDAYGTFTGIIPVQGN